MVGLSFVVLGCRSWIDFGEVGARRILGKRRKGKCRGRGWKGSKFKRGVFKNGRKAVILDKKKKIVIDGEERNMV